MDAKGFPDFRRAMFRHYGEGRYQDALAAAREVARRFPDQEARTAYWIACLLCRVGQADEALRILQEARGHGHWWGEGLLLGDTDLEPLRSRPDFQALIAECREAQRSAEACAKPNVLVFTPEGFSPSCTYPLLIALHGRTSTAGDCVPYFHPATEQGWVVAMPQGTQIAAEGMFTWDDPERAERDVGWAYDDLRHRYTIDPQRVILGGVSQGAALAMALAVKGDPIPARGVIAVIPSTRGSEAWLPHVPEAARRGVRGWILTGERDHNCAKVKEIHREMSQAGLRCELVVVPGLGHEVPDDFPARLAQALDFLLDRG